MYPASKNGLYSVQGRLLIIDLYNIWKAFHIDFYVILSNMTENVRSTCTRGHVYKLCYPLSRKDVKKRSFAVRCVNIWNVIPAEAVASINVETLRRKSTDFWGVGFMKFHNCIERKKTLLVFQSKKRIFHCECVKNL